MQEEREGDADKHTEAEFSDDITGLASPEPPLVGVCRDEIPHNESEGECPTMEEELVGDKIGGWSSLLIGCPTGFCVLVFVFFKGAADGDWRDEETEHEEGNKRDEEGCEEEEENRCCCEMEEDNALTHDVKEVALKIDGAETGTRESVLRFRFAFFPVAFSSTVSLLAATSFTASLFALSVSMFWTNFCA